MLTPAEMIQYDISKMYSNMREQHLQALGGTAEKVR